MSDEQNELNAMPNMLAPEHGARVETPPESHETKEAAPSVLETAASAAQEKHDAPVPTAPAQQTSVAAVPAAKDEVLARVEHILSEGLADVYAGMPAAKQSAFKVKGEHIAGQIKEMIQQGKMRVHNVLKLIREWLRMIPGVNKFFLEQEAKIKTDKIAAYAHDAAEKIHNSL